jgi:hypothetical protein
VWNACECAVKGLEMARERVAAVQVERRPDPLGNRPDRHILTVKLSVFIDKIVHGSIRDPK